MKISIVMATYNGENYIKSQLESIIKQTRKVDEIIIVDDCSTDNTLSIINDIKDTVNQKILVFQNTQNIGYKKNFKKGLSHTTGDIIILSDQDDIWNINKVQIMENIFQSNSNIYAINSTYSIIDYKKEDLDETIIDKYNIINKSILEVFYKNVSPGCTMGIRSEIVDIFLKTTSSKYPHDYELNMISALLNGCVLIDVPLTNYRIHSSNTIGLKKRRTLTETISRILNQRMKSQNDFYKLAMLKKIENYIEVIPSPFFPLTNQSHILISKNNDWNYLKLLVHAKEYYFKSRKVEDYISYYKLYLARKKELTFMKKTIIYDFFDIFTIKR